ncbi:hypothetical protein RI367_002206 [Sorochytrium milnesiophthora]
MPATLSDVASYTLHKRNGGEPASASHSSTAKPAQHQLPLSTRQRYRPCDIPLKDLRSAIPAHCFERSTLRSSLYLLHDLVLMALLAWAASYIDTLTLPAARWGLWSLYWVAQGVVCTGIWVIAHECGHQAFSPSKRINNTVGYVLHTALLVPYHSWRLTHSRHHKATGHLTKDQVFVPFTRDEVLAQEPAAKQRYEQHLAEQHEHEHEHEHSDLFDDTPILNLLRIVGMLLLGWPMYLLNNTSGQSYGRWVSHFFPSSPFFDERDRWDVIASGAGVAATLTALSYASSVFGFAQVAKFYLVPYLMVNGWLVCITFLQHTHPKLPHYSQQSFTFLRGALATVDRDYGILNYFFHGIGDTHVAHHMFSTMPHYHAAEATRHLRQALQQVSDEHSQYYHFDDTSIIKSLFTGWRECKYVETVPGAQASDVYWFNK